MLFWIVIRIYGSLGGLHRPDRINLIHLRDNLPIPIKQIPRHNLSLLPDPTKLLLVDRIAIDLEVAHLTLQLLQVLNVSLEPLAHISNGFRLEFLGGFLLRWCIGKAAGHWSFVVVVVEGVGQGLSSCMALRRSKSPFCLKWILSFEFRSRMFKLPWILIYHPHLLANHVVDLDFVLSIWNLFEGLTYFIDQVLLCLYHFHN